MKNRKKNILYNIIFYTLIAQSVHVISNQGLPTCFQHNTKRGLPPLPPTREQKQKKADAFKNLLEQANSSLHLSNILGTETNNQVEQSHNNISTYQPAQQESPTNTYAIIQYYERFAPQPNNANELFISGDIIPKIFLKHYNQQTAYTSLNLYPADLSLLEQIHRDAKKITADPPSFKITIGDQSYGIQYLTFNNDCRSLGEQIQDITDSKPSDVALFSLIIDENNIVTLKDPQDKLLLLRCTEFQFNHITTTELQFTITVLDLQYIITSINNNGTIKELLVQKKASSSITAKAEATEQEKQKYREMKKKLGIKSIKPPTDTDSANPQPQEQKSFIPHQWILIGGIGASIVTIAALIYFFSCYLQTA